MKIIPQMLTKAHNQKIQVTNELIASLSPYKGNARTHTKSQIRKIAESIRVFGFTNPVLIDRESTIVAGHGRVEAAKLLEMIEVPTIRLDNLTPAQVRAYVIADNRIAEEAGWDREILKIELQHLIIDNQFDISLTGFEIGEIDLIVSPHVETDSADELPEDSVKIATQPGDLWCLGEHRIFCGDLLDPPTLSMLMQDRKANLVFTDPPYNVVIDGNVSGKGAVKHSDFAMAAGEMSVAQFTNFLETSLTNLADNSEPGSVHFICMDFRHMREILTAGDKIYDSLLNLCVWAKNTGGQGSFYRSRHELVFVFRHDKTQHRNNIQLGKFGRYRTNVWEYPAIRAYSHDENGKGNLLALHPTIKPVAMIADAILDCSAPGDLVLDGFLGSGSTLIAAHKMGRVCYGVELDPRYVDVAIRRWEQFTGAQATHAGTGVLFDSLTATEVADDHEI